MRLANIKRHLAPYRFYGRLSTTVSYGVAAAMAPRDPVDDPRWVEALTILGQDAEAELTCVYCGALATSWDHLFPLVIAKEPTGHGHVVGNLVPACGSCNTQKGNRPWLEFVDALPVDRREVVRDRLQQLVERFIGGATPFDAHPFPPEARAQLIRLRAEIHERMREVDALVGAHRIPPRATSPRRTAGSAPQVADPPGSRRAFYDAVFARLADVDIRPPKLSDRGWTPFRNGPFGSFWIWLARDDLRAVCYLHTTLAGVDKAMFNTELFSMLLAEEDEIEAEVGEDLVWESLDERQACWIGLTTARPDLSDPEQVAVAADWTASALRRLIPALEGRAREGAAELRETPVESSITAPEARTVSLSWSEPWACPWDGSTDTTTWIDVFGPEEHVGYVTARMSAAQHALLPTTPDERFFRACAHLVARATRTAYEDGQLALPARFEPRHYDIEVEPSAVEHRMRADDLPDLEAEGGRAPVGDVEVADTYGNWPLTFAGLEQAPGGGVLALEIDAEHGPILTFDVRPPTSPASLGPSDPYWRAVAAVASDVIKQRLDAGAIAVLDSGFSLDLVVDLEEATRLARDDEEFERFAAEWPVEWPA